MANGIRGTRRTDDNDKVLSDGCDNNTSLGRLAVRLGRRTDAFRSRCRSLGLKIAVVHGCQQLIVEVFDLRVQLPARTHAEATWWQRARSRSPVRDLMPHKDDHLTPNPRPKCLVCGASMWLRRIEPEKPYYERRIYTCPSCNSLQTIIAHYDK